MNVTGKKHFYFTILGEQAEGLASQLLFYAPLVIWCLAVLLNTKTVFSQYTKEFIDVGSVTIASYVVLALREVLYGKWHPLALAGLAITAIMVYCTIASSLSVVATSLVFAYCGRDIPFRRHVLVLASLFAAVILVTVCCALIGIIPDYTFGGSGAQKHHLGFAHPNNLGAVALFVVLSVLYLREGRLRIPELLLVSAAVIGLYVLTGCDTLLICAVFAFATTAFAARFQRVRKAGRGVRVALCCIVPAIAVVSLALSAFYDSDVAWMKDLNNWLSWRISYGHAALEEYGISLLGQTVPYVGSSYYDLVSGEWTIVSNPFPMDCVYLRMIVQAGVVFTVGAVGLAVAAVSKGIDQLDYVLVAIIVCLAFYGVSESVCLYLYWNPFVMLAGWVFQAKPNSEGVEAEAEASEAVPI